MEGTPHSGETVCVTDKKEDENKEDSEDADGKESEAASSSRKIPDSETKESSTEKRKRKRDLLPGELLPGRLEWTLAGRRTLPKVWAVSERLQLDKYGPLTPGPLPKANPIWGPKAGWILMGQKGADRIEQHNNNNDKQDQKD